MKCGNELYLYNYDEEDGCFTVDCNRTAGHHGPHRAGFKRRGGTKVSMEWTHPKPKPSTFDLAAFRERIEAIRQKIKDESCQ